MIDDILTRECLFCGCILIDMIDNDIVTDSNKDFEFYQQSNDEAQNLLGNNDDDEEWEI
jgi:hypothetical protein